MQLAEIGWSTIDGVLTTNSDLAAGALEPELEPEPEPEPEPELYVESLNDDVLAAILEQLRVDFARGILTEEEFIATQLQLAPSLRDK